MFIVIFENLYVYIQLFLQVEKDSLQFRGLGGPEKKEFAINMKLYQSVNPDTVKYAVRPRCIEFALEKVGLNIT